MCDVTCGDYTVVLIEHPTPTQAGAVPLPVGVRPMRSRFDSRGRPDFRRPRKALMNAMEESQIAQGLGVGG